MPSIVPVDDELAPAKIRRDLDDEESWYRRRILQHSTRVSDYTSPGLRA